ncbi:MAG: hypothetical protein K2P50_14940 [Lachnospiraceae bacterium]|nr:hypothetical protein [Lachnospiraceae bacterium]
MRMTNKIMQNNSLYNINNNKVAQDRLSTMMATQKKITKPSDDPVIAIRALRLRTSVSEMTQFYEKNAPDANSWLDVTAQALKTVNDVLTDMGKLANKGNNKDFGSEDLQVLLGQLKALRDEFYSTGNTDYAGRYIFTGFRTDTPLSFKEDVEKEPKGYPDYEITENKGILDFDILNCTDIDKLAGLNKNNWEETKYDGVDEKLIENGDIHRLRLAYDVLKEGGVPNITYTVPTMGTDTAGNDVQLKGTATINGTTITDGAGNTVPAEGVIAKVAAGTTVTVKGQQVTLAEETTVTFDANGNAKLPDGTKVKDGNDTKALFGETATLGAGQQITLTGQTQKEIAAANITPASVTDDPDPYDRMIAENKLGNETILFIPETGELLFSNKAYENYAEQMTEESAINVTYNKNSWKDGDLRPEHYFTCKKTVQDENGNDVTTNYNLNRLPLDQKIEYDVGYNQKIQVNTIAGEVFGHGLDRDIDDMERALNKLSDIDATKRDLENVMKGMSEDDPKYNDVRLKYEAADKAYNYMRENVHNMFGSAITKFQGYLNDTNEAVTDNGTRSQRLDLISNRLMDQRSNFQTLKSENEDIDIAEVVVQLTSTELTYNAALMATGKIMQTSLMNYI